MQQTKRPAPSDDAPLDHLEEGEDGYWPEFPTQPFHVTLPKGRAPIPPRQSRLRVSPALPVSHACQRMRSTEDHSTSEAASPSLSRSLTRRVLSWGMTAASPHLFPLGVGMLVMLVLIVLWTSAVSGWHQVDLQWKKNGNGTEKVSPKARKANRVYSQWSFAELHALISYKAALVGSLAVKVDADYTLKSCPMCGHTADENRPNKGLLFVCQNPMCGYTLHANLVGARNVTLRTLLVRQDWARTGWLSIVPDASDREAKAARLQRYAELRYVAI